MANEDPPLGVRAGPVPADPVAPLPEPPVWPPLAQWCLAIGSAVLLVLVAWRGWGLSRYSARPLPIERAARSVPPAPAYQEPPIARAKVEEPPPPPPRGKKKPPEAALDLNHASAAELQQLPGIGPTLSARIVAGRPFASVEELRRVKGIGPKTLENVRPFVKAER